MEIVLYLIFLILGIIGGIIGYEEKRRQKTRDRVANEVLQGFDIRATRDRVGKIVRESVGGGVLKRRELKVDLQKTEASFKHCRRCGSRMIKKTGEYGRFWGCSSYPRCGYTESRK